MKTLLITNSIESSKKYLCQKLQAAWVDWVAEDNRRNERSFLQESAHFRIIDGKNAFEAMNELFVPEVVFIIPELGWANDDVNEGYDIARELITSKYKSEYIQVVFLSVLDRISLANIVDPRNKSMVDAFPHVCLLDEDVRIMFNYYSEIHYKLLKHLAISSQGRLQNINHEMSSVKSNILKKTRDIEINKADVIHKLEELSLFQQWTDKNINNEILKVRTTVSFNALVAITKTIEDIINEISLKLYSADDRSSINVTKKENYKVFIIEDDKDYRKYLVELLSKFYDEVSPDENNQYSQDESKKDFDISKAEMIIKSIGKKYDLFLLDLLYKDEAGNWLNFNGLDLYCLVKKVNPYAVKRIITSLPRGIVAKLVEVIMGETEKPNADQVFTKKYGLDALRDSIIESIDNINMECKRREKTKTIWAPFPKMGLFTWPGMSDSIFALLKSENGEFKDIVEKAKAFFNLFERGMLKTNHDGWSSGKLPNTRQEGDYINKIKGKLANILAHRLIVLSEALKHDECKIFYGDFRAIMKSICNLSPGISYFSTKLGFNVNRNENPAEKAEHWYQINLINLFPHEYDYVYNTNKDKINNAKEKSLKDDYPKLDKIFKEILTDLSIYDVWENVLKLDFAPYTEEIKAKIEQDGELKSNDFTDNFLLKNVHEFFQSLLLKYSEQGIPEIVERMTSWVLENHSSFELEIQDSYTNALINLLIDKDNERYSSA